MNFPRKQWALLTLWSFALVVPHLLVIGENIVGNTYTEGSLRLWRGVSPYLPPERGDVFLYSPFFAWVYRLFTALPMQARVLLWAFTNAAVYWLGISLWFRFDRKAPWYIWLAWIACSMEIDGPLRYQQINPLLVGLILIGCAAFRENRKLVSGAILGLAFNLKLIPAPFLALAFPKNTRFIVGAVSVLLLLFALPALTVGLSANLDFHLDLFRRLIAEAPLRKILDVASVGERWGFPFVGEFLKWFVAVVGGFLIVAFRFIYEDERFPWAQWISLTLATMLLINPRTESPTFVLIAPAYLFLTSASNAWLMTVAMWLITFSYNTLWPVLLRTPLHTNFTTKTLGVLIIWMVILKRCLSTFKNPGFLKVDRHLLRN